MKSMLLPVKTAETFQQHFDNNGWASPQAQVDAGYPYFIQPMASSAEFEYTVDTGTLIDKSVLLTLSLTREDIVPGVVLSPVMSVSTDNMTPWTDYSGYAAVASGFRYVRVNLAAAGDDHSILRIREARLMVSLEEIRDAGSGTANASDPTGTFVSFTKDFLDVESITVTALYQAAEVMGITAVYDFEDDPNPLGFSVYLFSNDDGARVSGDFSWAAKGT